jgi:hypothetical protein
MRKGNEKRMTLTRDYKHEYELRRKNRKRLVCEIDREKAQKFEDILKTQNITFSNWITDKINDHIKEA